MVVVKFDTERKQRFLDIYRDVGRLHEAARAVDVCAQTVRTAREKDEDFNQAVIEAYSEFRERLELEAYSRAVVGWEEPVYQGGNLVGTVLKKSDRILELMLKRHIPEYRERQSIDMNLSGGVLVVPGIPMSPEEWEEQHGGSAPDEEAERRLLPGGSSS